MSGATDFESLDFLYMPSSDVARDLGFYTEMLGGEVAFAIEAFGARVAQVRLSHAEPRLLLADHLDGEAPVLVFRVADLDAALAGLEKRGVAIEARFGIPHGPCATLRTPGGQRLALYQLTRPEVDGRFKGRMDFEPTEDG
jgi:predicted enzyme related to lactoylglutathione lyase